MSLLAVVKSLDEVPVGLREFYKKSPVRYKSYRYGCGRDRRLAELWGDAD